MNKEESERIKSKTIPEIIQKLEEVASTLNTSINDKTYELLKIVEERSDVFDSCKQCFIDQNILLHKYFNRIIPIYTKIVSYDTDVAEMFIAIRNNIKSLDNEMLKDLDNIYIEGRYGHINVSFKMINYVLRLESEMKTFVNTFIFTLNHWINILC